MSIQVQNISKNYGNQKALDGISFTVNKGEIVGFLGPNGAGKSTLMKVLTTFLEADSGTALVNGYDVGKQKLMVQKSVGYLPEHNPLYLDLYVREYLAYNATIYKIAAERIDEVINITGLAPESEKKIGQLSKGYRQRVGLATALLHNPDVLILDEPTTGLDPNQLIEIRRLIKNVGRNKTVFLSTHILQEVEAICDRVIIINQGKIVADKKIDALGEQPGQVVEVVFDTVIHKEELSALTDLNNAVLQDSTWTLFFGTNQDSRGRVFDFAAQKGIKILQIVEKTADLEHVFRDVTQKVNRKSSKSKPKET